jgi:hypothetical protein
LEHCEMAVTQVSEVGTRQERERDASSRADYRQLRKVPCGNAHHLAFASPDELGFSSAAKS